jgi:hypothetical protein
VSRLGLWWSHAAACVQGPFPLVLAYSSPNLTILDLGYNRFSGPLPDFEGMFLNLCQLSVTKNAFNGSISPHWAQTCAINPSDVRWLDVLWLLECWSTGCLDALHSLSEKPHC